MKEKQLKALKPKARQLGFETIEKTSVVVPPAATASGASRPGKTENVEKSICDHAY